MHFRSPALHHRPAGAAPHYTLSPHRPHKQNGTMLRVLPHAHLFPWLGIMRASQVDEFTLDTSAARLTEIHNTFTTQENS